MGASVAGAAAVVAAVFAGSLVRRWNAGGRINRALLYWAVSLAMFALASAALTYGEVAGWTSASFRIFYLFGGVLVVPWLALGTVQISTQDRLNLRVLGGTALVVGTLLTVPMVLGDTEALFVPGIVLAGLWGLLLLTAPPQGVTAGSSVLIATFTVIATFGVTAGVLDGPVPADRLPEGSELFAPGIRGFAVGGNALGAVLVVVGAVTSAWRMRGHGTPHRVVGNLLIGLGVLVAASGGFLAFLGETASHAIAFAIGVTIMYAGFTRTTRVLGAPPRAADPQREHVGRGDT
ncbi:MAG: hypothetical protein KY437_04425 [Actinobacteria bacterium]|nr:hypothetical protein [Actinomycetota bacterium]